MIETRQAWCRTDTGAAKAPTFAAQGLFGIGQGKKQC